MGRARHVLSLLLLGAACAAAADGQCSAPGKPGKSQEPTFDYSDVFSKDRDAGITFWELPGFTRTVYAQDHALVTPESRVWLPNPSWVKTQTAHIISPQRGSHFTMYFADMTPGGAMGEVPSLLERFVFVVAGEVQVTHRNDSGTVKAALPANHWAYIPPGGWEGGRLESKGGAKLLLFERIYALNAGAPYFCHGHTEDSPLLPTAPEVFKLRKLLPQTPDFDFNVHIMDFEPGEYLYVKESHYNQHGLLLLQGQGIYRLANNWYPVQAGDAIWMPPYVLQWYAALGTKTSRYILYKDTTVDPHFSP